MLRPPPQPQRLVAQRPRVLLCPRVQLLRAASQSPPEQQQQQQQQQQHSRDVVADRRELLLGSLAGQLLLPGAAAAVPASSSILQQPPPPAAAAAVAAADSCSSSSRRAVDGLRDPGTNAGCATAGAARERLDGLLPPRRVDVLVELLRARTALEQCSSDFEKHRLLIALRETNLAAFVALLRADLEALLPLAYTPVIGEACLKWGTLLQRPLGLYVSAAAAAGAGSAPTPAASSPAELVVRWPSDDVRVAVITDGERILGLGDLGAHGAGIPTGKAAVYLAAGTPPGWLLPITVDVGTSNEQLRGDPLYVGLPQARLKGAAYLAVMDGLLAALKARYGGDGQLVIHWEDLAAGNAATMLQRTRALHGLTTFNDDTQCTAAVALAAVLGAERVPGVLPLEQQTFCFFGAGQANLGVARLLLMALQQRGLSAEAARARIWAVDSKGLITTQRQGQGLSAGKAAFAGDPARLKPGVDISWSSSNSSRDSRSSSGSAQLHAQLTAVVQATEATTLIGAAAVPGAFGQSVLQALLRAAQDAGGPAARPVVQALSNPTSAAEVSFSDALAWTGGRVVFAAGSPFPLATRAADGATLRPAQANNCFAFSGLSQGLLMAAAAAARQRQEPPPVAVVDDRLLLVVAGAIADLLSEAELREECVLPRIQRLPEVTRAVAAAVAAAA